MTDPKPEPTPPKMDSLSSEQLPSDLRVAVSGGGIDKPNRLGSVAVLPGEPRKKGNGSKWLAIGGIVLFVLLLLTGTAYFLLGKVNLGINRGTLKLTLDPAGADVVIDGKFKRQSVSSLNIKLKAGEHTLIATKEGYLDWEQEFTLSASETKEINLKLDPTPNIEVLIEGNIAFPELVRNGAAVAYLTPGSGFSVTDLSVKEQAALFGGEIIPQTQLVNWAPGEPMALVKLGGNPKLPNVYDNRGVRGRFVPLGERPVQGAPRDTGISTWLFDDARQTAQGWQPVWLNESIQNLDFSPDGSRIVYLYITADGERSLVVAHPDGGDWERVALEVTLEDPELVWLNNDQYILMIDANGNDGNDQLFDLASKNLNTVMPDRIANTPVASSPDGTQILYISGENGRKLAVWNVVSNSREKLFESEIGESTQFVWQTDNRFIVSKDDGSLWYWDLNGKEKPVQFISAVGALEPVRLLYSIINHQLLVVEQTRILSLKA